LEGTIEQLRKSSPAYRRDLDELLGAWLISITDMPNRASRAFRSGVREHLLGQDPRTGREV